MEAKNPCSYCALSILTFGIVRYDQSGGHQFYRRESRVRPHNRTDNVCGVTEVLGAVGGSECIVVVVVDVYERHACG